MKLTIKKVEGIAEPVRKISSAGFAVTYEQNQSKIYWYDIRLQQEEAKEEQE